MHFIILTLFTCIFFTSFINNPRQAEKKKIMAIFAHPDDEAVTNVSSLLSRYAKEGHTVYPVIATKGELGTAKHANIPKGDTLAAVRAGEAICACKKLGIQPPVLLGLGDGSLAKDFTGKSLRDKLDSIFKIYQPDIVVTWGPDGGYGHMDHRVVHAVVTELFQSGANLQNSQLYYSGIPTESFRKPLGFQTTLAKWMIADNWKPVKKEYLTMRIKCSKQDAENAIAAMQCHQSQFSTEQMEDVKLWMASTGDTIYLRPFIPLRRTSFDLFETGNK